MTAARAFRTSVDGSPIRVFLSTHTYLLLCLLAAAYKKYISEHLLLLYGLQRNALGTIMIISYLSLLLTACVTIYYLRLSSANRKTSPIMTVSGKSALAPESFPTTKPAMVFKVRHATSLYRFLILYSGGGVLVL